MQCATLTSGPCQKRRLATPTRCTQGSLLRLQPVIGAHQQTLQQALALLGARQQAVQHALHAAAPGHAPAGSAGSGDGAGGTDACGSPQSALQQLAASLLLPALSMGASVASPLPLHPMRQELQRLAPQHPELSEGGELRRRAANNPPVFAISPPYCLWCRHSRLAAFQ